MQEEQIFCFGFNLSLPFNRKYLKIVFSWVKTIVGLTNEFHLTYIMLIPLVDGNSYYINTNY